MAANAAFAEYGIDDTSMGEIAIRAGLTRKTVYNLFPSKEAIALRLIADAEAVPEASYRARMDAGDDAIELLERLLRDSSGWCLANRGLARLALNPPERPSLEPPPGRPSLQLYVRDCLMLGQLQGRIRSDEDPNFMALVLLGVYGQAMLSVLAGGPFEGSDIERIVRVVVQGIGGTETAARPARDNARRQPKGVEPLDGA